MRKAQSPGLSVRASVLLRRVREMPVQGEVLVEVGDKVGPSDTVARAQMPGPVQAINIAAALGIPRKAVASSVLVAQGDRVERGQVLARTSLLFGLFRPRVEAPFDGVVESVSSVSGQMMLRSVPSPIELLAYLGGEVIGVREGYGLEVEGRASLVQGIFGIGGEAIGVLDCGGLDHDASERLGDPGDVKGKIVVVSGTVSASFVRRARDRGAKGIVAGSVGGGELVSLTGGEINLAATGDEDIGLTLVLTEGFGDLLMSGRAADIFRRLDGTPVSISGTTQVRAGVVRPEVLGVSLEDGEDDWRPRSIEVGSVVRIIRGGNFGASGKVMAIPTEPTVTGSGATALVYELELNDGRRTIVPRANVEQ